jgi:predicted RNA binding protein YcfA (HicA-like mRNA interferase family)
MTKFPTDAPKSKVIKALGILGFQLVREREHIAMVRENPDGTCTPLTMPNHPRLKASTLRVICTQEE